MRPNTQNARPFRFALEVEEIENRRKPGGCETSSSTSPLCTCPIYLPDAGNQD